MAFCGVRGRGYEGNVSARARTGEGARVSSKWGGGERVGRVIRRVLLRFGRGRHSTPLRSPIKPVLVRRYRRGATASCISEYQNTTSLEVGGLVHSVNRCRLVKGTWRLCRGGCWRVVRALAWGNMSQRPFGYSACRYPVLQCHLHWAVFTLRLLLVSCTT